MRIDTITHTVHSATVPHAILLCILLGVKRRKRKATLHFDRYIPTRYNTSLAAQAYHRDISFILLGMAECALTCCTVCKSLVLINSSEVPKPFETSKNTTADWMIANACRTLVNIDYSDRLCAEETVDAA